MAFTWEVFTIFGQTHLPHSGSLRRSIAAQITSRKWERAATAALPAFRSVVCHLDQKKWRRCCLGYSGDDISMVIPSFIGNEHVPTQGCLVIEG